MDPIDELEVDILEHTGDIELAQHAGRVTREAIDYAIDAAYATLGLPEGFQHQADGILAQASLARWVCFGNEGQR